MLSNNQLKIVFVFIVSYVVLFFLGALSNITGMHNWGGFSNIFRIDYMYYLLPIPGFFMMFFLIDWIEEFFETRFTRTIWFPLMLLVMSVIAFYIASFWLFCNLNNYSLSENSFCSANGAKYAAELLSAPAQTNNAVINFLSGLPGFLSGFFSGLLSTNFIKLFLESAFLVFVLAAVFGWLAKLIFFRLENAQGK